MNEENAQDKNNPNSNITLGAQSPTTQSDILNDDLNNFKSGIIFDYEHTGKLTHAYNDEQPEQIIFTDYLGNKQVINGQVHGMCLFPTDYTLDGFDGAIGYFNELLDIMDLREVITK